MTDQDPIVVLGGGPAGAAVAIGLVRLGHSVTLVTDARPFGSIEGVSERTVAGLSPAASRGSRSTDEARRRGRADSPGSRATRGPSADRSVDS